MHNQKVYEKLLEAQKEIAAIPKTQDNPYFKSKYADINAILAVVKPILNKYGLVLTQPIVHGYPSNRLETIITHIDTGQQITSGVELPSKTTKTLPDKSVIEVVMTSQEMGSAITYYRRYSLQSLLALEAVDDDAALASDKVGEKGVVRNKKGIVESVDTDLEPF